MIILPRIEAGAYELTGTYGHILYRPGEDPDRRKEGVPVKVLWAHQVQYRCSFVLQIGGEVRPGVWPAMLRGAAFELAVGNDGSLQGEATFGDGTSGTVYIGREIGWNRRPVLMTARSAPDADGAFRSKSFAGEIELRERTPWKAASLAARAEDRDDPDLTARSEAA